MADPVEKAEWRLREARFRLHALMMAPFGALVGGVLGAILLALGRDGWELIVAMSLGCLSVALVGDWWLERRVPRA